MNGFLPPFVELLEGISSYVLLRQGVQLVLFPDFGDIVWHRQFFCQRYGSEDVAKTGLSDLGQEGIHIADSAKLAFDLFIVFGDLLKVVVEFFKEGRSFLVLLTLEVSLF